MTDHGRRVIARHYVELLLACALLAGACAGSQTVVAPATSSAVASSEDASCSRGRVAIAEARSLVDKYCVACHSPTGSAGEDHDFRSDPAILARRHNIEAKLRLHAMPPPSAPQLGDAERVTLRCWAKQ